MSRDLAERVRALNPGSMMVRRDTVLDILAESTPAAPDEEGLARAIASVFREKRWMVVDPDKMPLPTPDDAWFVAIGEAMAPALARALASQDKDDAAAEAEFLKPIR